MNRRQAFARVTSFVLAAAVTVSMLVGVNGLATSEHAGHAQWLVQQQATSMQG